MFGMFPYACSERRKEISEISERGKESSERRKEIFFIV
jgi:hypothetical protein